MRIVFTVGLALLSLVVVGCRRSDHKSGDNARKSAKELAGIRPGEERDMGAGTFIKMHRMQATDPLDHGWQRATSTEGGFSVELPHAFNDFRIRSAGDDHVERRSYSVGAKTPGQLSWSATCIARRDGKLELDGGSPGFDKTEKKGTTAVLRTVDLNGMACVLAVEAQGVDPLPPVSAQERFLQSLKRTGDPVW